MVFSTFAYAKVQSAKLSLDVPSGKWKSVRLTNLPRNAAVKAEIKSDVPIIVTFVDETKYEKFPDIERPLFQGNVNDKITFSVKIPTTGHYYLVFNNISGIREAKLDITIHGASSLDAASIHKSLPREQKDAYEKTLGRIGEDLKKVFLFEPFPISVKVCGKGGIFSGPDGITICLEFVKKITETLGSRDKATNVLLFTIFHEMGHILLKQWGYPFYDNEEVADDFATVLIVLIGQKERLGAMTEYFISNPSLNELMAKAFKGDRHPLSIERARNIIRWSKDPDRFKRWQTIFIPHMQATILEKLKENSPSLVNISLIEKELADRNNSK